MNKKKNIVRVSGKEMILHADKNMLGNMLMIPQGRKLYIEKKCWGIPFGPSPWTLDILDSSLRQPGEGLYTMCVIEKCSLLHKRWDRPHTENVMG